MTRLQTDMSPVNRASRPQTQLQQATVVRISDLLSAMTPTPAVTHRPQHSALRCTEQSALAILISSQLLLDKIN